MATVEIINVALFCFLMVFVLLGVVYILLKLSTSVIKIIENKANK